MQSVLNRILAQYCDGGSSALFFENQQHLVMDLMMRICASRAEFKHANATRTLSFRDALTEEFDSMEFLVVVRSDGNAIVLNVALRARD